MTEFPAPDEIADENDLLDWSWDELTDGVREEVPDEDLLGIELFAGVPDDEIADHRSDLELLGLSLTVGEVASNLKKRLKGEA